MSIKPTWREELDRALGDAQNPQTATYLQLATIDSRNAVQVRTMVWRGFSSDNHALLMAVDLRSTKIANFSVGSGAQIVWYFSDTREQFRLSGELIIIDSKSSKQQTREAVWSKLSQRARLSFFATTFGEFDDEALQAANTGELTSNFGVLQLDVSEVDHLRLKQEPHQRTRHGLSNDIWSHQLIAL